MNNEETRMSGLIIGVRTSEESWESFGEES